MENNERQRILAERNDKDKAFMKSKEKQLERDQTLMPVDDLPLEDIKEEYREEKDGEYSKDQSSSEKKLMPDIKIKNDLPK